MRERRGDPSTHHLFLHLALADLGAHQHHREFAESEHVGHRAFYKMPMALILLPALDGLYKMPRPFAREPLASFVLREGGLVKKQRQPRPDVRHGGELLRI